MKIIFIFHVPGCSGILRNVPACSVFLVLSTAPRVTNLPRDWIKTFPKEERLWIGNTAIHAGISPFSQEFI